MTPMEGCESPKRWLTRKSSLISGLARRFYLEEGKAPGSQALQDALAVLEGKALFDGPEYPVFTRIAGHDGAIYLDLCNDQWEVVEISTRGWRVISAPPVRFRRTKGMLPLPSPVAGGSIEELRPFVNVGSPEEWILLVAWLLMAFSPSGPYPVLDLNGEQGSAKSTRARVLRSLIDPSFAPLRTTPREERDLMISARAGWILAFDNLSSLPQWLSDAFCRLATGGGFATRELYTDAEEVLFDAQRPILFTGIEDLAVNGDLLDRSIRLSLSTIPEEQRKQESLFWQEFESAQPRILGALLDVVAAALQNQPTVKLTRLPRMADFAIWIAAAEQALQWEAGTFITAYENNRATANDLALEASIVADTVKQLLKTKGPWEGTAKELLEALAELLPEQDTKARRWPKSPLALSNALRRLAPNFRAVGIWVTFTRSSGKNSKRLIRISTQSSDASDASVASDSNPSDSLTDSAHDDATLDQAEASQKDSRTSPSDARAWHGEAEASHRTSNKNSNFDAGCDAGDAGDAQNPFDSTLSEADEFEEF